MDSIGSSLPDIAISIISCEVLDATASSSGVGTHAISTKISAAKNMKILFLISCLLDYTFPKERQTAL